MQVTSSDMLGMPDRVDDPRSPLQKMNRKQLRAFCKHYGIPFEIEWPATMLVQLIENKGYNGTEPYVYPAPREPEVPHVPQDHEISNLEAEFEILPDVSRMTPPQLKKICRQRGITHLLDGTEITKRTKKVDLINVLMQNPAVSSEVPNMKTVDG